MITPLQGPDCPVWCAESHERADDWDERNQTTDGIEAIKRCTSTPLTFGTRADSFTMQVVRFAEWLGDDWNQFLTFIELDGAGLSATNARLLGQALIDAAGTAEK